MLPKELLQGLKDVADILSEKAHGLDDDEPVEIPTVLHDGSDVKSIGEIADIMGVQPYIAAMYALQSPDLTTELRVEAKELVAQETKTIRRVRTAAGVRRFHMPIGSIIVNHTPLHYIGSTNIAHKWVDSNDDAYITYQRGAFWTWRGTGSVVGEQGVNHPNEEGALEALDAHVKGKGVPMRKPAVAREKPQVRRPNFRRASGTSRMYFTGRDGQYQIISREGGKRGTFTIEMRTRPRNAWTNVSSSDHMYETEADARASLERFDPSVQMGLHIPERVAPERSESPSMTAQLIDLVSKRNILTLSTLGDNYVAGENTSYRIVHTRNNRWYAYPGSIYGGDEQNPLTAGSLADLINEIELAEKPVDKDDTASDIDFSVEVLGAISGHELIFSSNLGPGVVTGASTGDYYNIVQGVSGYNVYRADLAHATAGQWPANPRWLTSTLSNAVEAIDLVEAQHERASDEPPNLPRLYNYPTGDASVFLYRGTDGEEYRVIKVDGQWRIEKRNEDQTWELAERHDFPWKGFTSSNEAAVFLNNQMPQRAPSSRTRRATSYPHLYLTQNPEIYEAEDGTQYQPTYDPQQRTWSVDVVQPNGSRQRMNQTWNSWTALMDWADNEASLGELLTALDPVETPSRTGLDYTRKDESTNFPLIRFERISMTEAEEVYRGVNGGYYRIVKRPIDGTFDVDQSPTGDSYMPVKRGLNSRLLALNAIDESVVNDSRPEQLLAYLEKVGDDQWKAPNGVVYTIRREATNNYIIRRSDSDFTQPATSLNTALVALDLVAHVQPEATSDEEPTIPTIPIDYLRYDPESVGTIISHLSPVDSTARSRTYRGADSLYYRVTWDGRVWNVTWNTDNDSNGDWQPVRTTDYPNGIGTNRRSISLETLNTFIKNSTTWAGSPSAPNTASEGPSEPRTRRGNGIHPVGTDGTAYSHLSLTRQPNIYWGDDGGHYKLQLADGHWSVWLNEHPSDSPGVTPVYRNITPGGSILGGFPTKDEAMKFADDSARGNSFVNRSVQGNFTPYQYGGRTFDNIQQIHADQDTGRDQFQGRNGRVLTLSYDPIENKFVVSDSTGTISTHRRVLPALTAINDLAKREDDQPAASQSRFVERGTYDDSRVDSSSMTHIPNLQILDTNTFLGTDGVKYGLSETVATASPTGTATRHRAGEKVWQVFYYPEGEGVEQRLNAVATGTRAEVLNALNRHVSKRTPERYERDSSAFVPNVRGRTNLRRLSANTYAGRNGTHYTLRRREDGDYSIAATSPDATTTHTIRSTRSLAMTWINEQAGKTEAPSSTEDFVPYTNRGTRYDNITSDNGENFTGRNGQTYRTVVNNNGVWEAYVGDSTTRNAISASRSGILRWINDDAKRPLPLGNAAPTRESNLFTDGFHPLVIDGATLRNLERMPDSQEEFHAGSQVRDRNGNVYRLAQTEPNGHWQTIHDERRGLGQRSRVITDDLLLSTALSILNNNILPAPESPSNTAGFTHNNVTYPHLTLVGKRTDGVHEGGRFTTPDGTTWWIHYNGAIEKYQVEKDGVLDSDHITYTEALEAVEEYASESPSNTDENAMVPALVEVTHKGSRYVYKGSDGRFYSLHKVGVKWWASWTLDPNAAKAPEEPVWEPVWAEEGTNHQVGERSRLAALNALRAKIESEQASNTTGFAPYQEGPNTYLNIHPVPTAVQDTYAGRNGNYYRLIHREDNSGLYDLYVGENPDDVSRDLQVGYSRESALAYIDARAGEALPVEGHPNLRHVRGNIYRNATDQRYYRIEPNGITTGFYNVYVGNAESQTTMVDHDIYEEGAALSIAAQGWSGAEAPSNTEAFVPYTGEDGTVYQNITYVRSPTEATQGRQFRGRNGRVYSTQTRDPGRGTYDVFEDGARIGEDMDYSAALLMMHLHGGSTNSVVTPTATPAERPVFRGPDGTEYQNLHPGDQWGTLIGSDGRTYSISQAEDGRFKLMLLDYGTLTPPPVAHRPVPYEASQRFGTEIEALNALNTDVGLRTPAPPLAHTTTTVPEFHGRARGRALRNPANNQRLMHVRRNAGTDQYFGSDGNMYTIMRADPNSRAWGSHPYTIRGPSNNFIQEVQGQGEAQAWLDAYIARGGGSENAPLTGMSALIGQPIAPGEYRFGEHGTITVQRDNYVGRDAYSVAVQTPNTLTRYTVRKQPNGLWLAKPRGDEDPRHSALVDSPGSALYIAVRMANTGGADPALPHGRGAVQGIDWAPPEDVTPGDLTELQMRRGMLAQGDYTMNGVQIRVSPRYGNNLAAHVIVPDGLETDITLSNDGGQWSVRDENTYQHLSGYPTSGAALLAMVKGRQAIEEAKKNLIEGLYSSDLDVTTGVMSRDDMTVEAMVGDVSFSIELNLNSTGAVTYTFTRRRYGGEPRWRRELWEDVEGVHYTSMNQALADIQRVMDTPDPVERVRELAHSKKLKMKTLDPGEGYSKVLSDPRLDPEIAAWCVQAFEGAFGKRNYRTEISFSGSTVTTDTISVTGKILDENGNSVGSFERSIDRGDKNLYNAYLSLNPGVQGSGFAEEFYHHVEQFVAENGITTVTVHANIDVGGYAWARRGFDAVTDRSSIFYTVSNRLKDYKRNPPGAPLSDWQKTQIDHFIHRLENADPRLTMFEIAGFSEDWYTWDGETRSGRPIPMHLGKAALLGTSWHGKKDVLYGYHSKAKALKDAEEYMDRIREFMEEAEALYIPGDRYGDVDVTDYNVMTADLLLPNPKRQTEQKG